MRKILTCALVFCGLGVSLFAHKYQDRNRDVSPEVQITTPQPWQQEIINKEGWIEFGSEWLYVSSSLTPTFTLEQKNLVISIPDDSTIIREQPSSNRSVNPRYNSGFSVFLRYRAPSDNDMTWNYTYLRNNGDGSFNREYPPSISFGPNGLQRNFLTDHDKAHFHNHMHIFDFLVGRPFPLAHQFLIRLSGGLTVHDFYLTYQQSDLDIDVETENNVLLRTTYTSLFYKERHRWWGLGPKGQIDFQYLMLPNMWRHSLNFNFMTQFSLLFSKDWANGKAEVLFIEVEPGNNPAIATDAETWDQGAKQWLIPNVNLDFGLRYRWESGASHGFIFNMFIGYRVYAYWNMDLLFSERQQLARSTTYNPALQNVHNVHRLIYGAPYAGLSIAF